MGTICQANFKRKLQLLESKYLQAGVCRNLFAKLVIRSTTMHGVHVVTFVVVEVVVAVSDVVVVSVIVDDVTDFGT